MVKREFSSGGIVVKLYNSKIRVLLIKDFCGKWTWPKGKVDKGESPLDAAKREVREETGLKNILMIAKAGQTNYFYKRAGKLIYKTVYLYLFKFAGKEALSIQKAEIADGKWFSEEEALLKIGYKGAKELLKKTIRAFKKACLVLVMLISCAFAEQPGVYDSRDWNAGEFDAGGRMGSAEGMRVVPYRIDRSIKPGREMLKKKEAWEYIGNIKEKLLSGNYTGEILLRSRTDPRYNTLSDGIIFNTNGGRNYYIKRKNGEHMIMLDAPGGRQEVKVTKNNFAKFENTIHDDNDAPYVLFDCNGNEAAIVMVEWHTRVKQKFNENGEVIIILTGAKSVYHKTR
ncbi:MAG: NUDIX domain-containing protein [Candidatus Omnitrophota bacterium]|nr:NUDIX domain-containing protein [Candidatus Omnitrophota bacterium]